MKLKLITSVFAISALFCLNSCNSGASNKSETVDKSSLDNDFLIRSLEFKVKSVLQIGWGTTYKCKLLPNHSEIKFLSDENFILYVSVGSKDMFPDVDIHALGIDQNYSGKFLRIMKNEKPYTQAGTTGFEDNNGYIWLMISLQELKE